MSFSWGRCCQLLPWYSMGWGRCSKLPAGTCGKGVEVWGFISTHSRQLISHLPGFLGPDALKEWGTPRESSVAGSGKGRAILGEDLDGDFTGL